MYVITENGKAVREYDSVKKYSSIREASEVLGGWHEKVRPLATYDTQPEYREGMLVGFRCMDGYAHVFRYAIREMA